VLIDLDGSAISDPLPGVGAFGLAQLDFNDQYRRIA
jgi:hypothetical protein